MKVFKFGGASVKDAEAVKNVCRIIQQYDQDQLIVIISAMRKTTNTIEEIIASYFKQNESHIDLIRKLEAFHLKIAMQLFDPGHSCFEKIKEYINRLQNYLISYEKGTYNFIYDQVICIGELLSTIIVFEYLTSAKINCRWLDARKVIKTDNTYREANVNWELSEKLIRFQINSQHKITITQGFIGSDENNFSTSLGREGSDFTGAIFSYCLDATSLTIWKDVKGVLTGDPKKISKPELIENLTYQDAIEMTYYGASIIHPKTIKPLQNKSIPLIVKSFENDKASGTCIADKEKKLNEKPIIIQKENQLIINIATNDYSFIAEDKLSKILSLFSRFNIKINVFQTTALSLTVCVNNVTSKIDPLLKSLEKEYTISLEDQLKIITIRNYTEESIKEFTSNINWKLMQKYKGNFQIVY